MKKIYSLIVSGLLFMPFLAMAAVSVNPNPLPDGDTAFTWEFTAPDDNASYMYSLFDPSGNLTTGNFTDGSSGVPFGWCNPAQDNTFNTCNLGTFSSGTWHIVGHTNNLGECVDTGNYSSCIADGGFISSTDWVFGGGGGGGVGGGGVSAQIGAAGGVAASKVGENLKYALPILLVLIAGLIGLGILMAYVRGLIAGRRMSAFSGLNRDAVGLKKK